MAKKKTGQTPPVRVSPVDSPEASKKPAVKAKDLPLPQKRQEPPKSPEGRKVRKEAGGQVGNPGQTAKQELDNRISECREMLEGHFTKGEIKKAMAAKYGVDHHTTERYLSRAREQLLLAISETRDFYRSQSLAVYRAVLKDSAASFKEKMFAQRQIDHLLGLHAPWKVAQTDTDGKDVLPDDIDDRLSALAARHAKRVGEAGTVGGDGSQGGGSGASGPKREAGKSSG